MSFCKCIGKLFWESNEFFDGYRYRYVSMVDINANKEIKRTRHYPHRVQSEGGLHNTPTDFLKFYQSTSLYFSKLIWE